MLARILHTQIGMEQEKGNEELSIQVTTLYGSVIVVHDGSVISVKPSLIPGRTVLQFWSAEDEFLASADPDSGMLLGIQDIENLIEVLKGTLK